MFALKAQPIRIIGILNNQRPDKWSYTVYRVFYDFRA